MSFSILSSYSYCRIAGKSVFQIFQLIIKYFLHAYYFQSFVHNKLADTVFSVFPVIQTIHWIIIADVESRISDIHNFLF